MAVMGDVTYQISGPLNYGQNAPHVCLEIRSMKIDNIEWIDDTTGKKQNIDKMTMGCEFPDGTQVLVESNKSKKTGQYCMNPEDAKKGVCIVAEVRKYETSFKGGPKMQITNVTLTDANFVPLAGKIRKAS